MSVKQHPFHKRLLKEYSGLLKVQVVNYLELH